MSCTSATWAAFCLPEPDRDGYGYQIGLGLVRTKFADGSTRQRRRWTHWPRTWVVQWTVRADVLHTLSAWLAAFGTDWGELPLLSGEDPAGAIKSHRVRMIGDLSVQPVAGGLWRVRAELEQASGTTPADISGWEMPPARVDGYSYAEDYGIQRTAIASAIMRQRRAYDHRPRTFQVSWQVTRPDLARAEAWLNENGCAWGSYRLVDGETAVPFSANTHTARVAADISVSLVVGDAVISTVLESPCANEMGALESEVADTLLACTSGIQTSIPMDLDGAALADDWGDDADWGGAQP